MGYFRELPELEYQSFLSDAISSKEYLTVKNLFRRNKLRDDLQNVFTIFDKYDWVVLMTAGIINVRDEWPLSNYRLYQYVEHKYGILEINEIRYYETKEIKDSNNKLILPAGKIVDEDFVLNYSDNGSKVSLSGSEVRRGISNWEYETIQNNKKSSIYLLKRGYLQQFLNDMREIMIYGISSEYVNESLIRTENTKVTIN
jgi:hypothetical protein